MYNLPYFKTKDSEEVFQFMQQHPFALLVGCADTLPVATQVPLLIEKKEDKIELLGHFMRHTDHHKAFQKNANALCVFTGHHAYVSASWYTDPKSASTWNYMSVQAKGVLRFTDETTLLEILEKTTNHFEKDAASPAAFHQLPEAYINRLAKAIVGFTIEVQELDHVFKLSQNHDQKNYENIVNQLAGQDAGAQGIAAEMKLRSGALFNREGER